VEYSHWYWSPEWWSAIGSLFVGIIAAVIALTQERIIAWHRRASINSAINLSPPDSHRIKISDGFIEQDAFYIRMRVANVSTRSVAENIEVMMSKCWEISEDGSKRERRTFLPMNLKWSHYGGITLSRIPPGHFRHCDIGFFCINADNKVYLKIDTATQPNKVQGDVYPNVLFSGKYQIELTIGGDNIKTSSQIYEVTFNDDFYVTEELMFTENVSFKSL
jgi:hypothetical protein